MARARNIKPGFYKNEDLAECSVWARLIFPGLWMLADREGRLEDRPKRIKGELLPFDSQDVEPLLRELASRGFIIRYEIEGARYIQISKFTDHQTPHYTEKASVIPAPPLQESNAIKVPILQESTVHDDPSDSKKNGAIKGGSKLPDILIPDSLIPDSLIPEKNKRAFALPDWIPKDAWAGWLEMRRAKKAPNTSRAMKVAITSLTQLRSAGEDPAKVLDQSTERGWTGLFPIRGQLGSSQSSSLPAERL